MHNQTCSPEEYEETLKYLYDALPMFQRIGGAAFKKDLTNTRRFCDALGNPEKKFKSVHIAGTNGKGSSSHYLASILQGAGYRTGLYTSPHLKSFTERIRIDGVEAEREFVVEFVRNNRALIEEIKPSFFETTVVMAFEYFARHQVDIAVIEVGMGGRLDSTNVIVPEVCLITNIGFDHQQWLGDTLEKIATEKAGIIKPYVPVVVSEHQSEISHVFESVSASNQADLIFAGKEYRAEYDISSGNCTIFNQDDKILSFTDPDLPEYQEHNIPGVIAVCEMLSRRGFILPEKEITSGLAHMKERTGLKGRWQKLRSRPLVYCDVGHNIDGITYLLRQIRQTEHNKLFFIWGMVNDKDIDPVLRLMPAPAYYFFCQAGIPRALPAEALKRKADQYELRGEVIPDVNRALEAAINKAGESDLIVIGGSNFVVAEIESL